MCIHLQHEALTDLDTTHPTLLVTNDAIVCIHLHNFVGTHSELCKLSETTNVHKS